MKIKSLLGKVKSKAKLLVSAMTAALMVSAMSICACAEETTSTSNSLETIIQSAGDTLIDQFTVLVAALVPVLVGIAVVGLGLYAIVTLFSMAKKFFKKAAG